MIRNIKQRREGGGGGVLFFLIYLGVEKAEQRGGMHACDRRGLIGPPPLSRPVETPPALQPRVPVSPALFVFRWNQNKMSAHAHMYMHACIDIYMQI